MKNKYYKETVMKPELYICYNIHILILIIKYDLYKSNNTSISVSNMKR